jgi:DNA-binding protein Fis
MTSTTLNTPRWNGSSHTGAHVADDSLAVGAMRADSNGHDGMGTSRVSEAAAAVSGRSIQGATADGVAMPADALTLASQAINLPNCPEQFVSFIEDTPLERLVFWKLKSLFEKFDDDTPDDILKMIMTHVERPLFALVLRKTKGNQSRAAEILGCNRNTLHRKLKGFAIQPRDLRRALKSKERRNAVDASHEMVQAD